MDAPGARRRARGSRTCGCALLRRRPRPRCWWRTRSRRRPSSRALLGRGRRRRGVRRAAATRRPTRWPSASSRASRRTGRGSPRSSSTRARCRRSAAPTSSCRTEGAARGGRRRADPGDCAAVTTTLPTSLVGSYAQPNWLIDREKLAARFPPRVRARELWRVDPQWIDEAQDDATLLAIRDQERAGLDIVTDGEHAARELLQPLRQRAHRHRPRQPRHRARPQRPPQPGAARGRARSSASTRCRSRDLEFLQGEHRPPDQDDRAGPVHDVPAGAERPLRERGASSRSTTPPRSTPRSATCSRPAPTSSRSTSRTCRRAPRRRASTAATRSRRALDGHAGTTAVHICFGYAAIIHERPEGYSFLTELAAVGCDQISIETAQSDLDDSVLEGLPGKTIILGVLNLDDHAVETPEMVADRIRRALPYKGVGELVAAPDCGMKYLPRDVRVRQAAVAGGRRAARARGGLAADLASSARRRRRGDEVALALVQRERARRRPPPRRCRPAPRSASASARWASARTSSRRWARRPPPPPAPPRARAAWSPARAATHARAGWRLITHSTSHGAGTASIRSSTAAASASRPWAMTSARDRR